MNSTPVDRVDKFINDVTRWFTAITGSNGVKTWHFFFIQFALGRVPV
jgi:hypothetical protein